MSWGCDHSKETAKKHYVILDRAEVLRVGLRFRSLYELTNIPTNLFLLGAQQGQGRRKRGRRNRWETSYLLAEGSII